MKKMKILQVFEKIGLGGTEKMIYNLSRCFSSMGHENRVWVREKGEELKGVETIVRSHFPYELDVDVVLVHGGFCGTAFYDINKKKVKAPIVEIIHRNVKVDGNADYYIAPSNYTFMLNRAQYNIKRINNGIDFSSFCIQGNEGCSFNLRSDSGDIIIFRHARIVFEKGWTRFLWIMDYVLRKYDNVTFVICGEGDERLTKLLKNGYKKDKIKLLGWKEDVYKYLHTSDIYMETSYGEVSPLALIEASIFKLPIIAFDVPGINEIMDDNEYCIQDNNFGEYCLKLDTLINDISERKKRGMENYERALLRFDIKKLAVEYIACFEEVINKYSERGNDFE